MISKVAEMKINGLFKHSVDDIYCSDFYNLDMRCKYDDIDLLKYLLAKLDKENSVTSKNYKLIGKIVYCIDLFLNHLIENGKLEVNLFVKIIKFISEYDSSDEKNEEVDKYVLELKKSIAILIKRLNSNTLESVLKVVEKEKIDIIINSLDSDFINENLDKKEELNNEEELKESEESLMLDNIEVLNREDEELKKKDKIISRQEEELSLLKKELDELKGMKRKYEDTIKKHDELLGEVETLKLDKKNLSEEIINIERENKGYKNIIDNEKLKKDNEEKIFEILVKNLLFLPSSIDTLQEALLKEGFILSKDEVYEAMNKARSRVFISDLIFKNDALYKLGMDKPKKELYFDFHFNKAKVLDIVVTSDFHFASFKEFDKYNLDLLYDYCVKNNINYIFNLGDVFDFELFKNGYSPLEKNFDNFKRVLDLVNKAIEKMPKVDNIYHGFLGGNHDEAALTFGIDPIMMMANKRYDIFNLGYENSLVSLNGAKDAVIGMHHMKLRIEDVNDPKNLARINAFYATNGIPRSSTHLDILGHIHKNLFSFNDRYLFVPSYTIDREQNGFYHLKIYFDTIRNIESIILIPIVVGDKLYKTGEFIHKRTKYNC